jgi:hypothetical protein
MSPRLLRWLMFGLLTGLAGVVLLQQRSARVTLLAEISALREQERTAAELRERNERLAAVQPSSGELERLRADRAALGRLREEVAALRETAKARETARAVKPNTQKMDTAERLRDRLRVPTEEFANQGWKTPVGAFETFVWAAANGEVDTLAQALVFDPRWTQQVEALWANLSPATRDEYRSVERLFAALTIRDVPLGTAQLIHESQLKPGEHTLPGPGHAFMVTALTGADKKTRHVGLYFRPSDSGWQLLVPGAAVAKYRDQLIGK